MLAIDWPGKPKKHNPAVPHGRGFNLISLALSNWPSTGPVLAGTGVVSPFAADRNRLSSHGLAEASTASISVSEVPSPFTSSSRYGAGAIGSPRSMTLSEAK